MNQELLKKHLVQFLSDSKKNGEVFKNEYLERTQLVSYYQSFTSEKIASMSRRRCIRLFIQVVGDADLGKQTLCGRQDH